MPKPKRKATRGPKARVGLGQPIFVVLLLRSRVIRDAVASALSGEHDLELILGTDANVLGHLDSSRPTVVVITTEISDLPSTISDVKRRNPAASVIVIGASAKDIVELARRGAAGFVGENATTKELLSTIRSVALGNEVFPAALTEQLVRQIVAGGHEVSRTFDAKCMTAREREVLVLIAQGLSNKSIAHRLGISTHTVKGHVHNLLIKTALHTRVELALRGSSFLPRLT